MNLVVDDAVEVRLATKTEEESRRQLGMSFMMLFGVECGLVSDIPFNLQAKYYSRVTTSR